MAGRLHKRATTLLGASNRQRSDIGAAAFVTGTSSLD